MKSTLICFLLLFASGSLLSTTTFGQALKPRKQQAAKKEKDLTPEQQRKLADDVYELTKSATSASHFTKIIDECNSALSKKLNDENQRYFRSLLSWALAKRANKRLDSYFEILEIGNDLQAKLILKNAKQDADQAIKLNETNWKSFLTRGVANVQLEDLSSAAKDFEKVCELAKSKSYGWFNLAELMFQKREYKKALSHYQKSLEITKSDVQAMTGAAHCLVRLKQPQKAFEKYTVVIRMRPDSIIALINRGDAYLVTGKWQDAYDDYSKAAKIAGDQDSAEAAMTYQRAAWLLASCPDENHFQPDTALQLATTAIKKGGNTDRNLETLALAQAATGDFESAVKSQLKAIAKTKSPSQEMKKRLELYKSEKPFHMQPQK